MKRTKLAAVAALLVASSALAYLTTGYGKTLTASTTPSRDDGMSAKVVSLYNASATEIVFALVNCSTNDFAVRLAAGTTVPIPPESSYDFDTSGDFSVHSVCYATTSGVALVYLAAY